MTVSKAILQTIQDKSLILDMDKVIRDKLLMIPLVVVVLIREDLIPIPDMVKAIPDKHPIHLVKTRTHSMLSINQQSKHSDVICVLSKM
jgi:hypothetical protein